MLHLIIILQLWFFAWLQQKSNKKSTVSKDYEKICRICMETNRDSTYLDIFSRKLFDQQSIYQTNVCNSEVLICNALEVITSLKFRPNDGFPNRICIKCKYKTIEAYILKQQANESAKSFEKLWEKIFNSSKYEELSDNLLTTIEKLNESIRYDFLCQKDLLCRNANNVSTFSELQIFRKQHKEMYANKHIEHINWRTKSINECSNTLPDMQGSAVENITHIYEELFPKKQDRESRSTSNSTTLRKNHKDKTHICKICDKKFKNSSNLANHLRIHLDERQFQCEYCDKSFVQAINLKSHIRIHTKERPYICKLCPKTYNQASALNVHIRSHTTERKYKCVVCLKGFTNTSDLKKHMRIHDPSQHYKCNTCSRTFAQKVNLKKHIIGCQ